MDVIPTNFTQRIAKLHKEMGVNWLSRLPDIVADCTRRWSLHHIIPFEPLSSTFVASAVQENGQGVVLKVGIPDSELMAQIEALRFFDGYGSVKLLDFDTLQGALLLERLSPGISLRSVCDDKQTTSIAERVMRKLWKPVPPGSSFPTIAEWATGLVKMRNRFGGGCGPFPANLVTAAETLFAELIESMNEPVLLHGDLHHENILFSQYHSWVAIDPKGLVGEPTYEVGAFLRNPMPDLLTWQHPEKILAYRVDQITEEMEFERARIVGWGLAQAVLAAWWSYEECGAGWEPWISCARLFSRI